MSLAPNTLWLTDAQYGETKRSVLLEFSSTHQQLSRKFSFFPELHVPQSVSLGNLKEWLSEFKPATFKISSAPLAHTITASTFTLLEHIHEKLLQNNVFSSLIEPERQFLLKNEWNYFGQFEIEEENIFQQNGLSIPNTTIPEFADSISETLSELLESNPILGNEITRQIIHSHLLTLPLSLVSPRPSVLPADVFLENLFFQNGFSLPVGMPQKKAEPKQQKKVDGTTIDFSHSLPQLLTFSYTNIGPDTLNCSCCIPSSLKDSHILSQSLVVGTFNSDGFFFESQFSPFAESFHVRHGNKENRIRRQNEFCLNDIPVGPFYRGQKAAIPLGDAYQLTSTNEFTISSFHDPQWACTKNESFLSREISRLSELTISLPAQQKTIAATLSKDVGIGYTELLERHPQHVFNTILEQELDGLIASLPVRLASPESLFYSDAFAWALSGLTASQVSAFSALSKRYGHRKVQISGKNVVVSGKSPLEAVTAFSAKHSVPAPRIQR
jgi:hypothetical protein